MIVYICFLGACFLWYSTSTYFPKKYDFFLFLNGRGRRIFSVAILVFTFLFLFWNYRPLTAIFLGFFKLGLVYCFLPIIFKFFERYAR